MVWIEETGPTLRGDLLTAAILGAVHLVRFVMGSLPHADRVGPWLMRGVAAGPDSPLTLPVTLANVIVLLSPLLSSLFLEIPSLCFSLPLRISSPFAWEQTPSGHLYLPKDKTMGLAASMSAEVFSGSEFGSKSKEAHTFSLGLFYLSRWWLLRWPKVFFIIWFTELL